MRLLCAISHHGLGHLAQTAPILNALAALRADVEWLIWSGLPRHTLEGRLAIRFAHRHEPADVGLLMHDAVRVDADASRRAYLEFHQRWGHRIAQEAGWLAREGVDGVLSNVAYLPLAAAARAELPAVAFCSLNWWDIAQHYLRGHAEMASVFTRMRAAYQSARRFLALTPGLPMPWLRNVETRPPLASRGHNRRGELNARLQLAPGLRLVLLGFGGVPYGTATLLPAMEQVAWLVPDAWRADERRDLISFGETGLSFLDLMASCDALVTKVGYGSFVEAAGLGLPVLYLDRPDWPETPWLTAWLQEHARAKTISETQLFSPTVGRELEALWQSPPGPEVSVASAPATAARIVELLVA